MRRVTTLTLAAALVVAGLARIPAATAVTVPADVVVIPTTSSQPVTTRFPTHAGATYLITVTGAYSYNGRTSLADCGHWDPEDARPWMHGENLLIDGVPAACAVQPFSPTHTYQFTQLGTGSPFAFKVVDDPRLYSDNTGYLIAVVAQYS